MSYLVKDRVNLSRVTRKPVIGIPDQVPHKPGCTAIEYGYEAFEISNLVSRGIVICSENKGADLIVAHLVCAFDFVYMQKSGFLVTRLN